jgi:hypothetical protein
MNELAEFAVKVLKQYADEKHTNTRGASDLSPLEEWLLVKLCKHEMMNSYPQEIIEDENIEQN